MCIVYHFQNMLLNINNIKTLNNNIILKMCHLGVSGLALDFKSTLDRE